VKPRRSISQLGPSAKAGYRRAQQYFAAPEKTGCPTPTKKSYLTRAEAKRAIKGTQRNNRSRDGRNGRLHAYPCECGRFHVGTIPRAKIDGTWVYPDQA
jgi:hypothetical protein